MSRYSMVSGAVFAMVLLSTAEALAQGVRPPADVNVINREIRPVQICADFFNPTDVFDVPDGQLLVIEDASVSATLDDGDRLIGTIETTVDGTTGTHFVGRIDEAFSSIDYAGRKMQVHAGPGTTVRFGRVAIGGFPMVTICASGRLEQIP